MPVNGNAVFATPNHPNLWKEAASGSLSCYRGLEHSASFGGMHTQKMLLHPQTWLSVKCFLMIDPCSETLHGFGSVTVAENLLPPRGFSLFSCVLGGV